MKDSTEQNKKSHKGTWKQAFISLSLPVLIFLIVRWAFYEPYVIPSGSMVPTLLVHDYILVNKFAFGIRLPFAEKWLWQYRLPSRGDVVVFRSPRDREVYFIKRVIGLPGDMIEYKEHVLSINGEPVKIEKYSSTEDDQFKIERYSSTEEEQLFTETLGHVNHLIRQESSTEYSSSFGPEKVPVGHLFLMGDNRDESSDSRVWGFLPIEKLLGQASYIWLSCEWTLPSSPLLCDPTVLRRQRIFTRIQ